MRSESALQVCPGPAAGRRAPNRARRPAWACSGIARWRRPGEGRGIGSTWWSAWPIHSWSASAAECSASASTAPKVISPGRSGRGGDEGTPVGLEDDRGAEQEVAAPRRHSGLLDAESFLIFSRGGSPAPFGPMQRTCVALSRTGVHDACLDAVPVWLRRASMRLQPLDELRAVDRYSLGGTGVRPDMRTMRWSRSMLAATAAAASPTPPGGRDRHPECRGDGHRRGRRDRGRGVSRRGGRAPCARGAPAPRG